ARSYEHVLVKGGMSMTGMSQAPIRARQLATESRGMGHMILNTGAGPFSETVFATITQLGLCPFHPVTSTKPLTFTRALVLHSFGVRHSHRRHAARLDRQSD